MKALCISTSLFCLVCCAGCLSDSRENGVSLSGGNCKTSEYISHQVRQVREVSFLELLCGLSGLCVRIPRGGVRRRDGAEAGNTERAERERSHRTHRSFKAGAEKELR